MIDAHLPLLPILIPLAAAPLCSLLPSRAALGFAAAAATATLAVAILLLQRLLDVHTLSYRLGGWQAPWGIELRLDLASGGLILLVALIGAVALLYAPRSTSREIPVEARPLFFTAFLLCMAGLLGICATGDAFNLFVFLEISSLSSYTLIAQGTHRRALVAAFRYLIMGSIGATFLLIGIGLLYMVTGTLNMADLATRLADLHGNRTVLVAFGFISVGLSLKLALFPLHAWLPDAYAYAPTAVTAFIAATSTKVSVYAFIRFAYSILGADFAFGTLHADVYILPLAVLGIFVASTVAIFQTDLKRLLAYSSVAQIGYIALGVGIATEQGLTAGLLHIFNHGLMKGALFLVVGNIIWRTGSARLDNLDGLGKRMPLTAFAFVLGGLNLIGVPLTAGFVSKWHLVLAALDLGWWPLVALLLMGSLLAVVYVWRAVEVFYFKTAPAEAAAGEAPLSAQWPVWALLGLTFYIGVVPADLVALARRAAATLIGGTP